MRVAVPKGTSWSKLIRQILPTKFFLGLLAVAFMLLGSVEQAGAIPSPAARAYKLQGNWSGTPTLASVNPEDGKATAAFFGETDVNDLLVFDLKVGSAVVGQQCVYIDNKNETLNPQHQTLFVPLNSKKEWEAFKAAGALGVSITTGCESTVPAKVCGNDTTTYTTGKDRLGAVHTYSSTTTHVNGTPVKTIKMVCHGGTATTCPTWVEDTAAAVGSCTSLNSCAAQTITWSDRANCSASVAAAAHGATTTVSNSAVGAMGQVDMVCNDGVWLMGGSTVMVGPAGNQTSYNVPGSMSCNPSGTCGSANAVASLTAPITNLCSVGTASTVANSGASWTWSCTEGLSTTNCSAPVMTNGVCGSANGQNLSAAPAASTLCASGSASSINGTGPWSWTCNGSSGTTPATCSANNSVPDCPSMAIGFCSNNDIVIPAGNIGQTHTATNGSVTVSYTCIANPFSSSFPPMWEYNGASGSCPSAPSCGSHTSADIGSITSGSVPACYTSASSPSCGSGVSYGPYTQTASNGATVNYWACTSYGTPTVAVCCM